MKFPSIQEFNYNWHLKMSGLEGSEYGKVNEKWITCWGIVYTIIYVMGIIVGALSGQSRF